MLNILFIYILSGHFDKSSEIVFKLCDKNRGLKSKDFCTNEHVGIAFRPNVIILRL